MKDKRYTLYMDEIKVAPDRYDYFCLAGYAILESQYASIEKEVNALKMSIFGNTDIVLHENEIFSKNGVYKVLRNKAKLEHFWLRIKEIFIKYEAVFFTACIHEKDYRHYYAKARNSYTLALNIILEDYLHFLIKEDAQGDIYLESSNPHVNQSDDLLQEHYTFIKAHGTGIYDRRVVRTHLNTLNFSIKAHNLIGVQLADLIPNSVSRYLTKKLSQRTSGLIDVILKQHYDGGIDNNKTLFGLRVFPNFVDKLATKSV